MPVPSLKLAISCLRNAATDPEMWSQALPLITSAFGAAGASCFARNHRTGAVEWAYMSGPVSDHTCEYLEYYAPFDLFSPAITALEQPKWLTFSETVPQDALAHNEWYQDFVCGNGLADAIGTKIYDAGPRHIVFGLHYETVQPPPRPRDARFQLLLRHLQQAARVGQLQRTLRLKASLGAWTIDQLEDAVFVVYQTGRVAEINTSAEILLSSGSPLALVHGRLVATDDAEAKQLAGLLAAAGEAGTSGVSEHRMVVGRNVHDRSQLVTVYHLRDKLAPNEAATVLVRVVPLLNRLSPGPAPSALFGLSPAEERLAQALLEGRTLRELTAEFGVQMPTLRAQMRSVLRKCGVQRQVDLIRVLLGAH